MKSKLEVSFLVPQYFKTKFHASIKQLRTDNGSEFFLYFFFTSHNIVHQTSCIYTPQQNGVLERKYQHLLNVSRSLLICSYLSVSFFRGVQSSQQLVNRIPFAKLNNKTLLSCFFINLLFSHIKGLLDTFVMLPISQLIKPNFSPDLKSVYSLDIQMVLKAISYMTWILSLVSFIGMFYFISLYSLFYKIASVAQPDSVNILN